MAISKHITCVNRIVVIGNHPSDFGVSRDIEHATHTVYYCGGKKGVILALAFMGGS